MLFNQRLQLDIATTERVLEERGRQYELSRDTIAAVNRRAHDIRHQVARQLDAAQVDKETLAQVVRAVDVYDTQLLTGNDAVDTVLAEKGLACQREGIALTAIADGTALSFMKAADSYVLVGALLDEAISAAAPQGSERLTISLTIRSVGDMATIHLETFCASGSEADLKMAEQVADRYSGFVMSACEDGVLSLDAAIPLP